MFVPYRNRIIEIILIIKINQRRFHRLPYNVIVSYISKSSVMITWNKTKGKINKIMIIMKLKWSPNLLLYYYTTY